VQRCQSLTDLKLLDGTVRPQDIEVLGAMLANSPSFHDMARAIRENTSVTTLNLHGLRGVDHDGVPVLAAALHHDAAVIEDLTGNFRLIDRDAAANTLGKMLEVNSTLKSLVLECAEVDLVAIAELLPRMANLRVLHFRANNIRALATYDIDFMCAAYLEVNTSLENIFIEREEQVWFMTLETCRVSM